MRAAAKREARIVEAVQLMGRRERGRERKRGAVEPRWFWRKRGRGNEKAAGLDFRGPREASDESESSKKRPRPFFR